MNERKELIEQLRLDYTASNMALALMKQAADMLEADSEPKCLACRWTGERKDLVCGRTCILLLQK